MLYKNLLIEWHQQREPIVERVLWLEHATEQVVTIDIRDSKAFPVCRHSRELEVAIATDAAHIVEIDPYAIGYTEREIAPKHRQFRDEAWDVIAPSASGLHSTCNRISSGGGQMIGLFSDPYPDELLYNACGRYHDRMQYPGKTTVARELLGSSALKAVTDLLWHFETFLARLPLGHRYSFQELANRHTLLPLYSPFLTREGRDQLADAMQASQGLSFYHRFGFVQAGIAFPPCRAIEINAAHYFYFNDCGCRIIVN